MNTAAGGVVVAALATTSMACGARTGLIVEPSEDAGTDASIDVGADARADTNVDTKVDVGRDVALDATGDVVDAPDVLDAPPPCDPGTVVADVFGGVRFFAGGAPLPAGRYRVTYVDGCMKYSSGQDWSVNAYGPGDPGGVDQFWLVRETSADRVVVPPGTVGFLVGSGGFADFDVCVKMNRLLAPVEFTFAGGRLGVWLDDAPYTDNLAGLDGRSPTWRVECLP